MRKAAGLCENILDGIESCDYHRAASTFVFAFSLLNCPEDAAADAFIEFFSTAAGQAVDQLSTGTWKNALGPYQADALAASLQIIEAEGQGRNFEGVTAGKVWDRSVLWDLIEPSFDVVVEDQQAFQQLLKDGIVELDDSGADQLQAASNLLSEAFDVTGIERGEYLRNARQELTEVLASQAGGQNPSANLLNGFIHLFSSYSGGDAPRIFQRLGLSGLGPKSRLSNLVKWAAARAYISRDERIDAFETVTHLVRRKGEFLPWIDLARLSLEVGNRKRAASALKTALSISPLAFVFIFAEPKFLSEASEIARDLRESLGRWKDEVTAVTESYSGWRHELARAEKIIGTQLLSESEDSMSEFLERSVIQRLSCLDLAALAARNSRLEKTRRQEAHDTLDYLIQKAEEKVKELTDEVSKSQEAKNAAIRVARAKWDQRLGVVRSEQRKIEQEGKRAEKGCIWSFEFALIMFGIYIAAIAVFAFRGNSDAWKSPIALVGLVLSVIPIAMSFILQIAYITRKAGADSSARRYQKAAEDELNVQLKKIEKEIEASHADASKELDDAETALDRLQAAMIQLGGKASGEASEEEPAETDSPAA